MSHNRATVLRATVREVAFWAGRQRQDRLAAWLDCPAQAIPAPGRYLLASRDGDEDEPLATVLFAADYGPNGFLAAPPIPANWMPGSEILLHGPFGHGFKLPAATSRLAVAGTRLPVRALCLLPGALQAGMDVALFCDDAPHGLPSSVEVNPLSGLVDGVRWADFLAMEVGPGEVEHLAQWIGPLPLCPAEVLVVGPMPCGGLASCGVCAVNGRHGPLLACERGPVFPLRTLWR